MRGFLEQVVPDAASDYPVLVLARELAGARAGAQVRRATGVARPIIRAWPAVIPKREALFRPSQEPPRAKLGTSRSLLVRPPTRF